MKKQAEIECYACEGKGTEIRFEYSCEFVNFLDARCPVCRGQKGKQHRPTGKTTVPCYLCRGAKRVTTDVCTRCGEHRCGCPEVARVISFGLGGHGIDFESKPGYAHSHLSGYETPETFLRELERGRYSDRVLDGAWVIDKRAVVERDPGIAIKAPMCNADLPEGTHKPFADRETALHMAPALGGAFQGLAVLAQSQSYGGLDYVSPDLYAAHWRSVGARVGKLTGQTIAWERAA
jgi:hypothetical protein